ncbi:MAG: lytic transglycosylase domain-containing protein [Bacteroidota bacterium]
MRKVAISFFATVGFITTCIIIFTSFSSLNKGQNNISELSNDVDSIHLPQVVKPIPQITNPSFAGEPMPLNMDTRERLDRELSVNSYWQSATLLHIKNANKYFPIIEPILKEMGVPDDFKYLAVAESSLRNVQSRAKAKGFWQFRTLAAKELGLEVNDEVDERYHVEKATRAAAGYLKKLHSRFGSWANAAAAYNVGPTSFAKTLKKQGESSFYDVNVNDETGRYLFRLIAIKEIMKNPQNFGFYLEPQDLYERIDDVYYVEVDESIPDWAAFAKENGVSYRMLKYYNPWLRSGELTVIKNKYLIKLPKS